MELHAWPDFAPREMCLGPVSGLIASAEIAEEARPALRRALLRVATATKRLSRPHQWLCGDGGSWGDDAEFQVVGEDRMVMRWPGDLTLTLERVRRIR
ncbi:hypothetical protein HNO88_003673 [Novosphingobium chloroacetimidivorans]|uniref:Uncharacterized protein n=1 Tax=Novosphingobium chloroacetimidivorans TaxID=1428314 RepID=A0A7W7NYK8_9SPHN|nr:hypothetical protein [Novosphingobium chloroacetimidivorans]MBB4860330.1 hypothetical protein [Novosphingobium chloroacetimidivorans]